MWEIAADGVYYQQPREKGTVVLVVGSRKDVLVRLSVCFVLLCVGCRDGTAELCL